MINNTQKNQITKWITELNLPDKGSLTTDSIPYFISRGYLLGEIINRLNGKNNLIKGLDKNFTEKQIKLNVIRTLDFINRIEKIEKSRICHYTEIINKNDNAIWELLFALFKYFNK